MMRVYCWSDKLDELHIRAVASSLEEARATAIDEINRYFGHAEPEWIAVLDREPTTLTLPYAELWNQRE